VRIPDKCSITHNWLTETDKQAMSKGRTSAGGMTFSITSSHLPNNLPDSFVLRGVYYTTYISERASVYFFGMFE